MPTCVRCGRENDASWYRCACGNDLKSKCRFCGEVGEGLSHKEKQWLAGQLRDFWLDVIEGPVNAGPTDVPVH